MTGCPSTEQSLQLRTSLKPPATGALGGLLLATGLKYSDRSSNLTQDQLTMLGGGR